jgi:oxygen-independent coproporphyrinogen-3 oxidase
MRGPEKPGKRPDHGPGLYVHIPFCDGKCPYCAFYSIRATAAAIDSYLNAMERECAWWRTRLPAFQPKTIYLGGGTPSILSVAQLERLFGLLHAAGFTASVKEWSCEVNPVGATSEKLNLLRDSGVNRISLGSQSFDDDILKRLGRRHSVADVVSACAEVRRAGFTNWGLDLMACTPGVSLGRWERVVQRALAERPAHLSVYALTIEEGSRLPAIWQKTGVTAMDERMELRHLHRARSLLESAGFERYEISNYARTGRACRHNLDCWEGADYLGLGPAASSRLGLHRWTTVADLGSYCDAWQAGHPAPVQTEDRTASEAAQDDLIFGLRMRRGIRLGSLERRYGLDPTRRSAWRATGERLARLGLMERSGAYWRLTRRGQDVADAVAIEFMD